MPNSQNENTPNEVKIKFNSEVENSFTIKVIDENNQEVKSHSPKISDDRMEISIQLPILSDGIYKIEYYIISSNDGHAIEDDYLILIGETNNEQHINLDNGERFSNDTPFTNNNSSNSQVLELLIYALKALYYFGLVLLIGWLIWWETVRNYSTDMKRKYLLWGFIFQMVHLVGLISVILIQVDIFTSKGIFFTPNFPFDTSFGLFWLISLVLSLIGFICLFKNRWITITWLTVLVFCKSLNGHASTFDTTYISVTLNSVHLIAAAIWAAGLTFMVLFWRKHKLYVKSFLPQFSKYAFVSFIVLAVSGSIITFIYSPSFALLLTDWSRFLFVKVLLVAIVVVVATIIRFRLKEPHFKIGHWMKLDFSLMIFIIFIVTILTFLSPTP